MDGVQTNVRATLDVRIRRCREGDLEALEWMGVFTRHRTIIRAEWERHQRGEAVMLVAEADGFPVGQVWIDLAQGAAGVGRVWALRVLPGLRGAGIGGHLLSAAERAMRGAGCRVATMEVALDNARALELYERKGYRVVGRHRAEIAHQGDGGTLEVEHEKQHVLERSLEPS